ncbi:lipoate--protein ligase family protein [Fodinisporobacter ferrooxydans]|uniref:Lipoate--protein ligase family protein n=1 Tax=Fodinisporobacter ferrooxydans TaxID=2901836 RepID=A0ABY4CJW2_9BACL|nr:lipoate--protein ligase family protein [Alicyclobacillaceae bacterium MYW30-H2]
METWRFLATGNSSPAFNMAADEAVLQAVSQGKAPPTIRFFGWQPPTLSIGYFQQARRDIDFERLGQKGFGFVRRQTGGRAVLHDAELTYSVIVPESHRLMSTSVIEAYRTISLGLLEGFRSLGLQAELVSLAEEQERGKYDSLGSAACFDSPSWYELVVEGRKIVGSAQLRQLGTVLQHGSILLDLDIGALFDVLRFSNERMRERMKQAFAERAVSLKQLTGNTYTFEEVSKHFFDGFEKGLEIKLAPGELTDDEQQAIEQLIRDKYSQDSWNFRR